MKALQLTLLATVLGFSSQVMAADWTNYLKGMKEGCQIDSLRKTIQKKTSIPKSLQGDITKYTSQKQEEVDNKVDIRLKNATAYGQSITRISYEPEWGGSYLKVYFTNDNFTKIKPQFTVKVDNKSYAVGAKKAWLVDYNNEEVNRKPLSVSYKGGTYNDYFNEDGVFKDQSWRNANWYEIVYISDNGWNHTGSHMGEYNSLDFNNKNKTVTCTYSWG